MSRKVSIFIAAAAAVTAVACSPATSTSTDSSMSSSMDAVQNQATVYASRTAFSKGPGGSGSNSGPGGGGSNNSGPGGGSGGGQCTMPDSLVLDVGSNGGNFSYNGSSFVVPRNAVSHNVHIVMIPQVDSTVAIQFYPEGLQFNPNAMPTLTINTDCIGDPATASIVYTDSQGHVLEQKMTTGKTLNSVSTVLAHFSRYAVAW